MNGSVPFPALVEVGLVSDTKCVDGGRDDGRLVVVAPLTAPLGVEAGGTVFGFGFGFAVADCPAVEDDGVVHGGVDCAVHGGGDDVLHGGVDCEVHGGVQDGVDCEVHGGGVVVDADEQPVWAGFVLAMPLLPSHS